MSTRPHTIGAFPEHIREALLCWRGIEGPPCETCGGSGIRVYSSTATWRGGIGGASMTADCCNVCWGSGDSANPWTNLRQFRDEESARVAERAVSLLAEAAGARLQTCRPAVDALLGHLDALASPRRRKRDPEFFQNIVMSLASTIRRGLPPVVPPAPPADGNAS